MVCNWCCATFGESRKLDSACRLARVLPAYQQSGILFIPASREGITVMSVCFDNMSCSGVLPPQRRFMAYPEEFAAVDIFNQTMVQRVVIDRRDAAGDGKFVGVNRRNC